MWKFKIMSHTNQVKTPSIFIPVLFFIVFDMVALSLNFWISFQLEKSAVAINLSGRQRMLSQRMTKSLLMLQLADSEAQKPAAFEEFAKTVDLFDKTLSCFFKGGMTAGGDGKPLYLPASDAANAQAIIADALQLWAIINKQLQPVIAIGVAVGDDDLKAAMNTVINNNIQLLSMMNDLTTVLEQNATHEIALLRMLQATVLFLALCNFVVVCQRLMRQVRKAQGNTHSLRNIIDSIETGIVLYGSDGCVVSANNAAHQLLGYHDGALIGKYFNQLIFTDDTRTLGVRQDNSTFIAKTNIQTLFEGDIQISMCTIVDVSEQQRKEERLVHLAFYDILTGLPNRVLLEERLEQSILHAKRNSSFLAILFLDLDGFKAVNDNLGHDAGDELLQLVSKRFQQCCREVDTVARLGGDEFVFVLTSIHSLFSVKQIASNILNNVQQEFLIYGQPVTIGASIGIAVYPNDHSQAEQLIKYADDAMYFAKQNGKNRFAFFSELAGAIAHNNDLH